MARIEICLLVALFVSLALITPSHGIRSVVHDDDDQPTPSWKDMPSDFVRNCSKALSLKCGDQIMHNMYPANATDPVHLGTNCCLKLTTMGFHCHVEFVRQTLPGHRGVNTTQTWTRSAKVWRFCEATVAALPKPKPNLP
ncbi:hypothetical protein SLE2022_354230 [Rubroshorea leprosula]